VRVFVFVFLCVFLFLCVRVRVVYVCVCVRVCVGVWVCVCQPEISGRGLAGEPGVDAALWREVLWGVDCVQHALEEEAASSSRSLPAEAGSEGRPQNTTSTTTTGGAGGGFELVSVRFQMAINGILFNATSFVARRAYAQIVHDFLEATVLPRVRKGDGS
jgi:hypothetical protein